MTWTAATNSAPSNRYSPASAAMTAISDSALLMGCRCTSRLTAPPTQTAPKARNKMRWKVMKQFSVPSSQFSVNPSSEGHFLSRRFHTPQTENCEPRTENLSSFLPGHGNRRRHQIRDREGQQRRPAESHQLVVTEARQRPAHPNIKKKKAENLRAKPEQRQQRLQQRRRKQRPGPSPKK